MAMGDNLTAGWQAHDDSSGLTLPLVTQHRHLSLAWELLQFLPDHFS